MTENFKNTGYSLKKDIASIFLMIDKTRRYENTVLTLFLFKIGRLFSAETPESYEYKLCSSQALENGANRRQVCTLCH